MKKILTLSALALAMGMGVAVGAHQGPAKVAEVKADFSAGESIYVRLNDPNYFWGSEATMFANYQDSDNNWHTEQIGKTADKITTKSSTDTNVYKFTLSTSAKNFQILRRASDGTTGWDATDVIAVGDHNLFNVNSKDYDAHLSAGWASASVNHFTVSQPAHGTISVKDHNSDVSGEGYYYSDWEIEVTCTPASGYIFKNWTDTSGNDWTGSDKSDNPVVLTNIKGDFSMSAKIEEDPDITPSEDGYYLVGTKNNYMFKDAEFIEKNDRDMDGNVGYKFGYTAALNEQVTIRSYFNSTAGWINNADPRHEEQGEKAWGYRDGDNFHFTAAGDYDIFVKEDCFYVAQAAKRVVVGVVARLFSGRQMKNVQNLPNQLGVEEVAFTPSVYNIDGYVFRGFYTDVSCTAPFVDGTILEKDVSSITLQAKYIKVGYYILHSDSTPAYSINGADIMLTDGISENNKAEGTIEAEIGTTFSVCYFRADGEMDGHAGLGGEYDYVAQSGNNFVFTKAGTYSVFWSAGNNKVYITAGLEAFLSYFLSEIGGICDADGVNTNHTNLAAAWAKQEAAYNALESTDKAKIVAMGFNGVNAKEADKTKDEYKVVMMFSYIVTKYGTNHYNDFIFDTTHIVNDSPFGITLSNTNAGTVAILVIAGALSISTVCFFVFKRRKQIEE